MVGRLGADGIVAGRSAKFDKQIDGLVEDQVQLKDQQIDLMKKVKIAQKKMEAPGSGPDGSRSAHSKTMQATFSGGSFGGAKQLKSLTSAQDSSNIDNLNENGLTFHQEQQLRLMKDRVAGQTKTIQSVKHQIEDVRNVKMNLQDNNYLFEHKRKADFKLIEAK